MGKRAKKGRKNGVAREWVSFVKRSPWIDLLSRIVPSLISIAAIVLSGWALFYQHKSELREEKRARIEGLDYTPKVSVSLGADKKCTITNLGTRSIEHVEFRWKVHFADPDACMTIKTMFEKDIANSKGTAVEPNEVASAVFRIEQYDNAIQNREINREFRHGCPLGHNCPILVECEVYYQDGLESYFVHDFAFITEGEYGLVAPETLGHAENNRFVWHDPVSERAWQCFQTLLPRVGNVFTSNATTQEYFDELIRK